MTWPTKFNPGDEMRRFEDNEERNRGDQFAERTKKREASKPPL